ncbi:hypothetical protein AVEN_132927-1 [Araneus ventricosus]|uniref:Uncharacterized protein n=1 Tax=Araneus ventricosus TaxID=182803 RepID=A0A4Y2WT66_ARAVE|nr:hypothetical protein AVEN_132927-1 [Araneus ventricosus]
MSVCGIEFHACCTWSVSTGTVNAGCGRRWSCRPIMSHTCSIGERSGDLAGKCTLDHQIFRHSVEHVGLKQRYEGECYPVGKHPLNASHEWQHNRLNHQSDV